jgi:hypothetical protein
MKAARVSIIHIPVCSPDYNSIEEYISKIKEALRGAKARTVPKTVQVSGSSYREDPDRRYLRLVCTLRLHLLTQLKTAVVIPRHELRSKCGSESKRSG